MQAALSTSVMSITRPAQFTCTTTRRCNQPRRLHIVAATPPKGVTQPPVAPSKPPATFGFVDFAEKMNSRAAMIGFFALLLVEGVTGKGLLELLGYNVGQGLNLAF